MKSTKWPFFVLLFSCFAGAILGDSTAESLLLARFGSRFIPGLFLVNALFLFVASTSMISVIDRIDRGMFFIIFAFTHACVLVIIRLAVMSDAAFLFLPLFSYAYVTKILMFLLFWTLANDIIDTRKAGREFPFIAAGGTLGAIGISFSIPWLLRIISAENLLLVWSGTVVVTTVLFLPVRRAFSVSFRPIPDRRRRAPRGLRTLGGDLKLVKTEPLLWNMAILYFLLFFTILNQQYLFYSALKHHFMASADQARELAKFIGYFNGTSMFLTFALQLTAAGAVLKRIGSTRSMFILPIVLTVVFGLSSFVAAASGQGGVHGLAIYPPLLFWGIVAGMATRIAFFDSFFSPNFQVFFSSLPKSMRGRGKLSLEGIVKPLAMVCAGLWLAVVMPRIGLVEQSLVLFGASLCMIFQTLRLKHTYTQSLTTYLRSFESKNAQWLSSIVNHPKEAIFLDLLKDILRREEHDVKEYIIEILTVMNSSESKSLLLEHLPQSEERTRAMIVSGLGSLRDASLKPVFLGLLASDKDERVVANCITALAPIADDEARECVRGFLSHANNRVRANAVVALWPHAAEQRLSELKAILGTMLTSTLTSQNASALYAMGEIQSREFIPSMQRFHDDKADLIFADRRVWRQFILALSKCTSDDGVTLLLRLADRASKKQRIDCAVALDLMLRQGFPPEKLVARLRTADFVQRAILLRALSVRPFELKRASTRVLQEIAREEVTAVYGDWVSHVALGDGAAIGRELLRHAVDEECIGERMESLSFLAALLDGSGQVRKVLRRLHHSSEYVRARAFEVLDNTGDFRTNRLIIKLLESSDAAVHSRNALADYHLKPKTAAVVVRECLGSPSTWVRFCAEHAANTPARSWRPAGRLAG